MSDNPAFVEKNGSKLGEKLAKGLGAVVNFAELTTDLFRVATEPYVPPEEILELAAKLPTLRQ
jgi:hypothetical protein